MNFSRLLTRILWGFGLLELSDTCRTAPPIPADPLPLQLRSILRIENAAGQVTYSLAPEGGVVATPQRRTNVCFAAVKPPLGWPEGLVPVFGVEQDGQFRLRRLPLSGQENDAEPLFFAVPALDEPMAADLAGTWHCRATHADGLVRRFNLELAVDGEHVSARFDPNSDYRVAVILPGSIRSNLLTLEVAHVSDHHQLKGELRRGIILGTWRQLQSEDRGDWEATRPAPKSTGPNLLRVQTLYEWRRVSDDRRRYGLDAEWSEPGWERLPRSLGRVWPASSAPNGSVSD